MADPDDPMTQKEAAANFLLVLQLMAEQSLELELLRTVLKGRGLVTDEELASLRQELQRRWKAQGDAAVERVAEKIRRRAWLEKADMDGPAH
jgi:hypothetical protein